MLTTNNNIIDIDLSATQKKKFRINGDDNRIIELNTSDMNIVKRINESYPKLEALQQKAAQVTDVTGTEKDKFDEMATLLADVDIEMRQIIDYIFDTDVSSKVAPDGSMYDIFNGTFRYEYILTTLLTQYENNMNEEFKRMEKKAKAHTDKYTKGR